jgi:hypothetical protein
MAQSSFGYFGIGVESTAGTAVAPTKFLPVKDVDFPVSSDFIEVREIRGSRQAYSNFDGPQRPDVSFTSALYPAGAMGVLFTGVFGTVTTAAAGASATAKKHTFADAPVLPSLSMERSDTRTNGTGVLAERLNGVKIESMSVTANYGADVEVAFKGQGLDFPTTPGTKPVSFAATPAMDPMIFTGATVSVDATPNNYFKTLNFDFTNTLMRQESLRGARTAYKIYEGGLACTLSGTMIFDDTTMYLKFKNSTSMAIKASFTGAVIDAPNSISYNVDFTWPKVKISQFGAPMKAGDVIEADVTFQVSYDFTAGYVVQATMTNLETTGTYAT